MTGKREPRPGDRIEVVRGTAFYEGAATGRRGKFLGLTKAGPWARVRLIGDDGKVLDGEVLVDPGNLRRVDP